MQAASRSLRHANRPGTPIAQKGSVGLLGPAWHFAAMTDPETVLLAADFPPATREEWRKLVDAVLKGAPFERLVSTTYDGLAIEPLAARRSDAKPVAGRAGATPWEVLARIDHPDPARANEIALRELNNGASGLALVFSGSSGDHGFGLDPSEQALTRALEGVRLDAGIALDIDLTPFARDLPQRIAELVKQSADPAATKVRFGYDPLTAIAITGKIPLPWSETAPLMARLIRTLADAGFKGPFAVGDGRVVHNAGGSEAQELSFALACAVAYLRALEASGMALESARDALYFRLSADADQFLTVAKFRAARKLWARIEAACGLSAKPVLIAAETAWRMMARRDPHVNILRATIAVFAAALGGADAITVLPFTAACGLPDRFARRIARNTQLILGEESHLAKVADPAAGSGAVEDLTDALCQMAWALFRDIEAAGRRRRRAGKRAHPGQSRHGARKARGRDRAPPGSADRREHISELARGGSDSGRTFPGRENGRRATFSRDAARSDPPRAALRSLARGVRSFAGETRRASESLSRHARHASGIRPARGLCQEFFRSRRHRGGERRQRQPRSPAGSLQSRRLGSRLPVFDRQGL
jgi:methylmalonyl-CoA mutase N-terminal domain/subunit